MKKLLIIASVLCAITTTGCSRRTKASQPTRQEQQTTQPRNSEDLSRKYFDGHSYIVIIVAHGAGLTHDPDCECFKEGGAE